MTANVDVVKQKSRAAVTVLAVLVLLVGLVACGRQQTEERQPARPRTAGTDYAEALQKRITGDALMGHLQRLQQIADEHGGNRAAGRPGYDASVDYVAQTLRDKGFDVQTPEFEFPFFHGEKPSLTVGGQTVEADVMEYSKGTGPQGVSGPLIAAPVEDTPGCTASDYDGLPVSGAVVLVDRGACQFAEKERAAAERGAVAMIIADNVLEDRMSGTLGARTKVKIPVINIGKTDGERLRANPGPTTIKLNASTELVKTRSVIAQTKTGSTQNVVLAGAHLDSVAEGPGINDNGSGVATVLETAVQLGSSPQIQNMVRFAFWGAEELGLVGSAKYLQGLDVDGLKDIAVYMNFDMVGSPNPGYFTYDGDQSEPPDPNGGAPRVPEGSAGIERILVGYLNSAGKPPQDTSFDGRSDYASFTQAGIPSGGLFTGADSDMSDKQAELWGGHAGEPFDPNYHKDTDNVDHIDRTALDINGRGVAYVVGLYAQDLTGRNGVPVRDDRTRHTISDN